MVAGMPTGKFGISFVAALVALFGAAGFADARSVRDAAGRTVEIADTARIVTIGGAVTEIVFALGHGDRVVAVDQTSAYPPAARAKPNVGYMRALSAEGVLALAPTLVLAIEGSGPPAVIDVLSRASVPFVLVPEGYDREAVLRKVRFIAEVLGENERGETMARALAEDFAALQLARAAITRPRAGVFVLAVGNGTPTVAGSRTGAEGLFALGGVRNAIHGFSGYKPAVAESTLAAAPDVVVTMRGHNHAMAADEMFALPAFAGTPAARERRLIPVPSYFLTFGPRTAHAARDLIVGVYPELSVPALPRRPWTDPPLRAAQ
jgi:iron complex transport system substrate-binding protein